MSSKDRGPKEFTCSVCDTATYEKGPCHNCGAGPFEDEARDIEWYCAGCGETYETKPGISCPQCEYNALTERSLNASLGDVDE